MELIREMLANSTDDKIEKREDFRLQAYGTRATTMEYESTGRHSSNMYT